MRLEPFDDARYPRFWALFEESMPPGADGIYASLGVSAKEAAGLPRTVGELRQIETGAGVVGYAWIEVRARVLHVHALLLEPSWRGKRLGAEALAGLEAELRDRVDEIELGVLPGNEQARALYARAGFEQVGERLGFLLLRKRL